MMVPSPDALREMQEAQKEQRAALEMLTKQLSQVAMSLGELRGNEGEIPATVQQPNGRENVNAVSLKSEEVCQNPSASSPAPTDRPNHERSNEPRSLDQVSKGEESSTLEQVTEEERVVKTEEESVEIKRSNLPSKKADPGVFTLPISIRDVQEKQAMCDLGASINIMPYSIYEKLRDAKLVHTDLVIQLADGSTIYPEGILEDEIVKVNKFTYPADFFVIKITGPIAEESPGVLLGRPFLSTASTVIDVGNGTMHLNFNGERLTFGINENVRKPQDSESMQSVEIAEPRVQEHSGEELPGETSIDPPAEEMFEKEAAEWMDVTMTGEMSDEAIEKAIMDFCKPQRPAESSAIAQPARIEKPPDQSVHLRSVPEESPPLPKAPTPAGQLTPIPTLPATARNLPTQVHQKPRNQDLHGQKSQLLEELVSNQRAMKKEVSDLMGIDPGPCLRSTISKGMTPHLDQQSRKKELTMGQKELLSQHRLNLMSKKRKSRWAGSETSIVSRTKGSVERQSSNPDSPSFLVNGRKAEPYRDKTKAGIVEEIPLTLPNLSQ